MVLVRLSQASAELDHLHHYGKEMPGNNGTIQGVFLFLVLLDLAIYITSLHPLQKHGVRINAVRAPVLFLGRDKDRLGNLKTLEREILRFVNDTGMMVRLVLGIMVVL